MQLQLILIYVSLELESWISWAMLCHKILNPEFGHTAQVAASASSPLSLRVGGRGVNVTRPTDARERVRTLASLTFGQWEKLGWTKSHLFTPSEMYTPPISTIAKFLAKPSTNV